MCGICGKVYGDPARPVDPALIAAMNRVQAHRGPDDDAVWTAGPVGLGQRRLAIIDLSPGGRQPMSNEDGALWITFNGEIYNHRELRAGLEARGHRYRGQSDTETILHLYEELGRGCVRELRGMFAFALWDSRRQSLLLARDRFGKKPLLYAQTAEGLVFASEIKALLQDPAVPRAVNEAALHHYLTYGFVPGPESAFAGICKLPPGCTLLWEDGRASVERYWALEFGPKLALDEDEAAQEVLRLLRESVRLRLISDVPLGAFLSGGIDSSAVTALMAEASAGPVQTFSIGFEEESFDERPYARQVARRYGTDHHEFTVRPDAAAVLPELVWAYGEPFADSSALPTYYVAAMTRRHVTVALNGDGGDELFAGYERYLAHRLGERYARLPGWLRRGVLRPLAQRLPEPAGRKNPVRRAKNFVLAQDEPPDRRYVRWLTLMDNAAKAQLYTPEFAARIGAHSGAQSGGMDSAALMAALQPPHLDGVDRLLAADVAMYLPDDLLVKVDIAAMWCSLEARSPFLDHKLAEFAARLPGDFKLRGRTGKYILKKALAGHLPPSILRRDKRGFAVPLDRWFRGPLHSAAAALLLDRRTQERGLFVPAAVKRLLDEHRSGRANHRSRIWELLMLELWHRTYIDRPRAALTGPDAGLWEGA